MRLLTFAAFLAVSTLPACTKGDDTSDTNADTDTDTNTGPDHETDCTDGKDEDNDGQMDCADSDCTADPACQVSEDCANGTDDDGDGNADCADDDCATISDCQPLYTYEGTATVDVGVSYTGQETERVEDYSGAVLCEYTWDTTGDPDLASNSVAPCTDPDGNACSFAFAVTGTNGRVVSGCPSADDTWTDWGTVYGYGFMPSWTYTYGGNTYTYTNTVMWFLNGYWYAMEADEIGGSSRFDGTNWNYEVTYHYYY